MKASRGGRHVPLGGDTPVVDAGKGEMVMYAVSWERTGYCSGWDVGRGGGCGAEREDDG